MKTKGQMMHKRIDQPKKQARIASQLRKSELPAHIKKNIKWREKGLGRTCRRIWHSNNEKGTQYLFGSFCLNRNKLVVTIAFRNDNPYGYGWVNTQHVIDEW